MKKNVNAIINLYSAYIEELQGSMNQSYDAIRNYADGTVSYLGNAYTSLKEDDIQVLSQELQNLRGQYAYPENVKENERSNILNDDFSIQLHSQFSIAYDGDILTQGVVSWKSREPCSEHQMELAQTLRSCS